MEKTIQRYSTGRLFQVGPVDKLAFSASIDAYFFEMT